MERLYVYADFDWLDSPALIGELTHDVVRGNETYGFSYEEEWLAGHGDVFLSEDLLSCPGIQYTRPGKDIFACFSDALPDRWGRTLLNRREQVAAAAAGRLSRRLSSFDYLTGIDDTSRMGGFRFSLTRGGAFINSDPAMRVPPLAGVRELMRAAREIEESEQRRQLPAMKWLAQLLRPGTSLGGARPKATVVDDDGALTVAKFPSRTDDCDVALWEHFCHVMGRKAGLNVADTRVIAGGKYHILLSRRFDRTAAGKRVHFASALTLLGLDDGDNASTGFGYTDIVEFILRHGCEVEQNLEELFRRVAFYIIVGNTDDHFRNHGFLLTPKGWVLSPAYDINPTTAEHQTLLINRSTNESDLNILLQSAGEYMLTKQRAEAVIAEVRGAMRSWEREARRIGLAERDFADFGKRVEKGCGASG